MRTTIRIAAASLAMLALAREASAQSCTSTDPAQWPAAAKPYFLVLVDTSRSMGTAIVGGTNSCGYEHNRLGDARCATKKLVQAFAGEVHFGLATFAPWKLTCPASAGTCATCNQTSGCFTNAGCSMSLAPNDDSYCGPVVSDAGLTAALNTTNPGGGARNLSGTQQIHAGGLVAVPLVQDSFWTSPPNPRNTLDLLALVDDQCGNGEVGAYTNTPLGGALFGMYQYLSGQYRDPFGAGYPANAPLPSPIGPATFNALPAERPCRPIHLILITDGDETCDQYDGVTYPGGQGLAVFQAGKLLGTGVTVDGQRFPVKTWVVGLPGSTPANLDSIAAAGGTATSLSAANEAELAAALSGIVAMATRAETCDNADNNCNGCTDEGFSHFADVQNLAGCCTWKTPAQRTACGANPCPCCSWATPAERTSCISSYLASVTGANPLGDRGLLACTTAAQAQSPSTWLCQDPGERCDEIDNNGDGRVDEGFTKCGSPARCPASEVCNGLDDDCDGVVDQGSTCQSVCAVTPSAEVCNGCDDDCDGFADGGISVAIPCGFTGPSEPAYCAGVLTCKPPQPVARGACGAGGGFTACTFPQTPPAETCNNLDDDCNGLVDDNLPSIACVPAGAPAGLNYGPNSQCKMGMTQCANGASTCVGWSGPAAELCDGIDNDCDGAVDDNAAGVGVACGRNQPPCTPGTTACVGGALVCQGGVQPAPEVCDGVDNNCNGAVDDGPLADGPVPGQNGCWQLPGNCCTFHSIAWCPPSGAACNDAGVLGPPCGQGTLACQGGAWACTGGRAPEPETCNGVDDDCNGTPDDGPVPGIGAACGSDVGECTQGTITCAGGMLSCSATGPSSESCDGLDNDCNGVVDDGLDPGASCVPAYDAAVYPGDRSHGACRTGTLACGSVCVGAVAPAPELCNGIDDDCDGSVDEAGAPPDGLDGTANPAGLVANLGDPCGPTAAGACRPGSWSCASGRFACTGAMLPAAERCNGVDDDCDGTVDEPNAGNSPPVCPASQTCVATEGGFACAPTCDPGAETPCPTRQKCVDTTPSGGGAAASYCLFDGCGNCALETVTLPGGAVACAPAGTELAGCERPPLCVCNAGRCAAPCAGVTCPAGEACNPDSGACVADRCPDVPCAGCNKACVDGACVDDPCVDVICPAGARCVPQTGGTSACLETVRSGGCGSGGGSAGGLALLGLAALLLGPRGRRSLGAAAGAGGLARLGSVRSGRATATLLVLAALGAGLVGCGGGATEDRPVAAVVPGCTRTNGGVEICDGADNDCNGVVDDLAGLDLASPRSCGRCGRDCFQELVNFDQATVTCVAGACGGSCAAGWWDVDGLVSTGCEYACVKAADGDSTADRADDDCDGRVDEDADFCTTAVCGDYGVACIDPPHALGRCVSGTTSGPCAGHDGVCVMQPASCVCTGPGDCWWDLDGSAVNGCEYRCDQRNGGVELCNGLDDDCDGVVDEAVGVTDPALGVPCAGGVLGVCADVARQGTVACADGELVCTGANVVRPADLSESCNGLDDDCNGSVDDQPTDAGGACGGGAFVPCSAGRLACQGGALVCVGAVNPGNETCNGVDDDCDGTIDDHLPAAQSGGPCDVPLPPPPGATSACRAGATQCAGGVVICVGSVGPTGPLDTCGVDANCDGVLTNQPAPGDLHHCGACGNDCTAGAVHASWACVDTGTYACQFQGCQPGFYDTGGPGDAVAGDQKCGYPCTFASAQEACNGIDDNCDGQVDEPAALVVPSVSPQCGVSPGATSAACSPYDVNGNPGGVSLACTSGAWVCTFHTAGVCSPSCAAATEICDTLDNDCDGLVNETSSRYGQACASDTGQPPPGDGACRTVGTYVCDPSDPAKKATRCSAVKDTSKALAEACNGTDDDCDGLVDETFQAKGASPSFVRPAVTKVRTSVAGPDVWIYSYEASRPGASTAGPGTGNGYTCAANCGTNVPAAPAGVTIDKTRACSVQGKIPWFNVTPVEVEQTCRAMGGRVCTTAEWKAACVVAPIGATTCQWGYAPNGAACETALGGSAAIPVTSYPFPIPSTATRWCNLGPTYDFSGTVPGDQDGLLVTGSLALKNCFADWSALLGNNFTNGRIFDVTGNLREITKLSAAGTTYPVMGGAFSTADESGATCTFDSYTVDGGFQLYDLGFRCCFDQDPTQ